MNSMGNNNHDVAWPASSVVCTSCTRGVQENGAIGLVILQSTEILGLIAIHFLRVSIENYHTN